MGRILEFIRYPSHSRTLGLLAILAVLLSIPLTVNIAQKQQELRQHAAGPTQAVQEFSGPICGGAGHCEINVETQQIVSNTNTNPKDITWGPNGQPNTAYDAICHNSPGCTDSNGVTTPPNPSAPSSPTTGASPSTVASPATGTTTAGGSCNASKGQVSPCTSSDITTTFDSKLGAGYKFNPQQCPKLCPDGKTPGHGVSVMQCVSTYMCWYDAHYDPGSALPNDQSCYWPNNDPTQGGCSTVSCPTTGGYTGNTCTQGSASKSTACTVTCSNGQTITGHSTQMCSLNSNAWCWYDPYLIANSNQYCFDNSTNQAIQCPNGTTVNQTPPAGGGGTSTSTPTPTPTPTAAAAPASSGSSVVFNLVVGLYGIGAVGDNQTNVNKLSNQSPKTTSRSFQIQVYDQNSTLLTVNGATTSQVTLDFDSSSGRYAKTWTPGIAAGTYSVRITTYGHLWKHPSAQAMAVGQAVRFQTDLPAGNLNPDSDNSIGADDYTALGSCAFQSATSSGLCQAADLDDSGFVGLSDLNLLIRDFGLTGDN